VTLRRPFRKIVVSDRQFVWKLRGNRLDQPTERHIVVGAADRKGHLLIDPYPWELEITPATVSFAIQFALANGWDPDRRGAPMILGYRRGAFLVLPSGVRFTHELPATELPDAASLEAVSDAPSVERLAEAVRAFSPLLHDSDIRKLAAAFSAILLEPGKHWEALCRGSITRAELRDVLIGRSQTFLYDAFQAPVSVVELEEALAPAFDKELDRPKT
jgi:hypothetical protein